MTKIIGDTACPQCKSNGRDSKDNHLILFDNGKAVCNRCGYREEPGTFTKPTKTLSGTKSKEEIQADVEWVQENSTFRGLQSRKLAKAYLEHYGIRVGLSCEDGQTPVCYYMPIHNEDGLCGYKVKTFDKDMWIKGSGKEALFFGADVVPKKGKRIYITEGQEDAVALYQVMRQHGNPNFHNRIAVVSLQNGAGSADKEMVRNRKLLDRYKEVVLCFDQDEAGKEAVDKVLTVLPRDKVRLASYQLKDCNEMLKNDLGKELFFSVAMKWTDLEAPRPEKIISMGNIPFEKVYSSIRKGIPIIFPGLQAKIRGWRYGENAGELTVWTAAPGVGKTSVAREVFYNLNKHHHKRLGHIYLEESEVKTAQAYVSIDNDIPLADFRDDHTKVPEEAARRSYEELCNNGRCFSLKHWGSLASEELMDHMYYLSKVEKCDFIMLDHISLVVSGQEESSAGERKDLDILMTKLAAFCEESGTSVHAIVHLKRPAQGSYNEGKQISLSALRGSSAIEGLAHNVIAIEGNQQGKDPNIRHFRVLKCREIGSLGLAGDAEYIPETGRLVSIEDDEYMHPECGGLSGER